MDAGVEDGLTEAVRAAAKAEILPRFRNLSAREVATKSGPHDLVTEADRAAERAIAAAAQALVPGALVVGEEAAESDPGLVAGLADAEKAVIIDPLDGTSNFVAGLATFGVILALREHGETTFGLLYDPVFDDWVLARRGRGAWYCRPGAAPRRLTGRAARPRGAAQGFVPLFLFAPDSRAAVAARLTRFGRVDNLRCSCHEYRMLALGQADFLFAPSAKPWDHAAGALVVAEIGGRVATAAGAYDPAGPRAPLLALADGAAAITITDVVGT